MGASEILSWVSKSRKIGEKRMSEKVKKLSRSFEDQDDDINQELGRGELGGVKVVHGGLDKVIEGGGAVVLTLKDQSILAADGGDINQEIDMLENVEIGEQKQRDEAYKAAKKRNQVYDDDKFNNEVYDDDPVGDDEGFTLDASGGGFGGGDAKKKLEELRKISGRFENLNSLGAINTSDYYTHEEMLQFKKPKKNKKSLRSKKEEKLDIIDALEAEAIIISTGLLGGSGGDLVSRNEGKIRQAMKKKMEQEKSEAEMTSRSNAYKAAYAKADEASKALRPRLDQEDMKVKQMKKRKAEPADDMSPSPPPPTQKR